MSIKLENNKIIITEEIDLEFLVEKAEEIDLNSSYSIQREIKTKVLTKVEQEMKEEIIKKLKIPEIINKGNWEDYEKHLNTTAYELIQKTVEDKIQNVLDRFLIGKWGKAEVDKIIEQRIREHFDTIIYPKISGMLNTMININPLDLIDDIQTVESNLSAAYNAGGEAATNSIRNS